MSSGGRYMYHHPQGLNYEYASYPPSYENASIPQPPLRSMRSTSSQSHSPHSVPPQPQFNTTQSQSSYPSPYGSTTYGVPQQPPPPPPPPPPSSQQQWPNENWTSNYNQSFPPPTPVQEVPFNSGPGRPDNMVSTSPEQRTYATNPDPRRADDRQAAPPIVSGPSAMSQTKRRRDKESPTGPGVSSALPGLDFVKLLDTYRLIMDSGEAFTSAVNSGRPPPYETVERMLQSANFGAQMFESVTNQQSVPPDIRPPAERDMEEVREGANGTANRQTIEEAPAQEGQTCLGCNATSTPEWRRGPMGPRTLCNACGLVYAKLIKKRVRESGRGFGKSNGQGGSASQGPGDDSGAASSGEGGSDDGDSYGSQDRRSEGGDGRD